MLCQRHPRSTQTQSLHPGVRNTRTPDSNHILQLELLVLRTFKVTDPIALTKSARRGARTNAAGLPSGRTSYYNCLLAPCCSRYYVCYKTAHGYAHRPMTSSAFPAHSDQGRPGSAVSVEHAELAASRARVHTPTSRRSPYFDIPAPTRASQHTHTHTRRRTRSHPSAKSGHEPVSPDLAASTSRRALRCS